MKRLLLLLIVFFTINSSAQTSEYFFDGGVIEFKNEKNVIIKDSINILVYTDSILISFRNSPTLIFEDIRYAFMEKHKSDVWYCTLEEKECMLIYDRLNEAFYIYTDWIAPEETFNTVIHYFLWDG